RLALLKPLVELARVSVDRGSLLVLVPRRTGRPSLFSQRCTVRISRPRWTAISFQETSFLSWRRDPADPFGSTGAPLAAMRGEWPRHFGSRIITQMYTRSEEHTSELQSRGHLVCRL